MPAAVEQPLAGRSRTLVPRVATEDTPVNGRPGPDRRALCVGISSRRPVGMLSAPGEDLLSFLLDVFLFLLGVFAIEGIGRIGRATRAVRKRRGIWHIQRVSRFVEGLRRAGTRGASADRIG